MVRACIFGRVSETPVLRSNAGSTQQTATARTVHITLGGSGSGSGCFLPHRAAGTSIETVASISSCAHSSQQRSELVAWRAMSPITVLRPRAVCTPLAIHGLNTELSHPASPQRACPCPGRPLGSGACAAPWSPPTPSQVSRVSSSLSGVSPPLRRLCIPMGQHGGGLRWLGSRARGRLDKPQSLCYTLTTTSFRINRRSPGSCRPCASASPPRGP